MIQLNVDVLGGSRMRDGERGERKKGGGRLGKEARWRDVKVLVGTEAYLSALAFFKKIIISSQIVQTAQ